MLRLAHRYSRYYSSPYPLPDPMLHRLFPNQHSYRSASGHYHRQHRLYLYLLGECLLFHLFYMAAFQQLRRIHLLIYVGQASDILRVHLLNPQSSYHERSYHLSMSIHLAPLHEPVSNPYRLYLRKYPSVEQLRFPYCPDVGYIRIDPYHILSSYPL